MGGIYYCNSRGGRNILHFGSASQNSPVSGVSLKSNCEFKLVLNATLRRLSIKDELHMAEVYKISQLKCSTTPILIPCKFQSRMDMIIISLQFIASIVCSKDMINIRMDLPSGVWCFNSYQMGSFLYTLLVVFETDCKAIVDLIQNPRQCLTELGNTYWSLSNLVFC